MAATRCTSPGAGPNASRFSTCSAWAFVDAQARPNDKNKTAAINTGSQILRLPGVMTAIMAVKRPQLPGMARMVLPMALVAQMPAILLVVADVLLVLAHVLFLGLGFLELALGHILVDLALILAHIALVLTDVAVIPVDLTGFLLLGRGRRSRGLLGKHQRAGGHRQQCACHECGGEFHGLYLLMGGCSTGFPRPQAQQRAFYSRVDGE